MNHLLSFQLFENKNPKVAEIQQFLLSNGFYDKAYVAAKGKQAVDGIMGTETTKAIKAYQVENGLPVTGQADKVVLRKMDITFDAAAKALLPVFTGTVDTAKNGLKAVASATKTVVKGATAAVKDTDGFMAGAYHGAEDAVKSAGKALSGFGKSAGEMVSKTGTNIISALNAIGSGAVAVTSAALDVYMHPFESILKVTGYALPLHLRGVIHFILGREDEFIERELTDGEEAILYHYCEERLKNKETMFDYPFWRKHSNGILPTAITEASLGAEIAQLKSGKPVESFMFPSVAGQYMYFLGATKPGSITKKGNTITVTDFYDFNEGLTTSLTVLCKGVSAAMNARVGGTGTSYQVIRKLVALRHATGYKGYPVRFVLKKPTV